MHNPSSGQDTNMSNKQYGIFNWPGDHWEGFALPHFIVAGAVLKEPHPLWALKTVSDASIFQPWLFNPLQGPQYQLSCSGDCKTA